MSAKLRFGLSRKDIQAALLFASDDKTRHILNSVHIDQKDGEKTLLVSADGRRMAVIQSERSGQGTGSVTIDKVFAAAVLQAFPNATEIDFAFTAPARITASVGATTISGTEAALIDKPYPNWRVIIPKGERKPVSVMGFRAEYLADLYEAAELLGNYWEIALYPMEECGVTEIAIRDCPRFYLALMPLHEAKVDWFPQAWLSGCAE